MIIVQKEWYSVEQCMTNPLNLYIFGDNTKRVGKGGQAQIRNCSNSFGIATKLAPSMDSNSFFKDDIESLEFVEKDIKQLLQTMKDYKNVVFPYDQLGSGLSDMPNKCPLLYRRLNRMLNKYFKVGYI